MIKLRTPSPLRRAIEATSLCAVSSGLAAAAFAQSAVETKLAPDAAPAASEDVKVTARPRSSLNKLPNSYQNTPQTIDVISQAQIRQQAATSLTDALRYAPGITLNSGEGGAHGDNINLRGFSAVDAFFLDGVRDPGSYTRDNFNAQSIEVVQGPASVLFGNSPAGGMVNETSKQPSLTALRGVTLETGTNGEARGTLDVNEPIGPTAAVRLNLMGETTGVAGRDYIENRRWGAAPSLALGIGTPTTFKLSYFHQEENNLPDYGIPFLFGYPAPVDRSLYYGLKDSDVTRTNVHIVSAVLKHEFNDNFNVTNTARYASYWSDYRVSAPHFGNDFVGGAPLPGTPLADILVYRDRPSSEGLQTYLTDHTDATARFDTGFLSHILIAGVEFGRQTTDYLRYNNEFEGIDGVAPTPLLSPDPNTYAPPQNQIVARPDISSDMIGLYATDSVHITPKISVDLGLRYDRYDTSFSDSLADTGFHRVDTGWTPKVALVFQATPRQTYYATYTTSFDPAVSYLTLAASDKGPPPQTARTFELGAKNTWLDGQLHTTAAVFHIDSSNITVSDPDDPTLQEMPGSNQRVQGVELTASGYLTSTLEIQANYTYLDPEITKSANPAEVGKQIPAAARNNANLWAYYERNESWRFGFGLNYVGHRFADPGNTANVPGYIIFNAVASWHITDDVALQANVQNIGDAKYFTGAYFSDPTEAHVLPGQGRVLTVNTSFSF